MKQLMPPKCWKCGTRVRYAGYGHYSCECRRTWMTGAEVKMASREEEVPITEIKKP